MISKSRMLVRTAKGLLGAFVVLGLLGLAGCDFGKTGERDIKFNHKAHIEEGLTCLDCHKSSEAGGETQMPKESTCAECHGDEVGGADRKPTEQCLKCHNLQGEKSLEGRKVKMGPKGFDDIIFSHALHLDKNIECSSCHGAIAENQGPSLPRKTFMPKQATCSNCHAEKGVKEDCDMCHKNATPEKMPTPASHEKSSWGRRHGFEAELYAKGHGQSCETCHTKNDCQQCHPTRAPANHNMFWNRRGHGVQASMNRDSCMTCHKRESCDECHMSATPMTHIGDWGNRHCKSCHISSRYTPEENGCAVCHKTTLHPFAK